MFRSLLDYAAGGAVMMKTVSETKDVLENMLRNHS
jgi:hypothetical protein